MPTAKTPEITGQTEQFSPWQIHDSVRVILASKPFRTSKQCQDLLLYIVEHSITGEDADLKERVIGVNVFGRKPDYDTNEDPAVRIRAAEVRKRLAQYYLACDPGTNTIRIDLQAGSYRAHFLHNDLAHSQQVEPSTPHALESQPYGQDDSLTKSKAPWVLSRWANVSALCLFLVVAGGVTLMRHAGSNSPLKRFWAPFIAQKRPVVIYLGTNAAYVFSNDFLTKYRAAHNLPDSGPEFFVDLPPGGSVRTSDLVPVKGSFVTAPDVAAIIQLANMFNNSKIPFVLRTGNDLSFGDLRNQPSVMVGAFNNAWTLELTRDLPYSFRHSVEILNRDHPEKSWVVPGELPVRTGDDYALISRLLVSKTGGPAIALAGIGDCGTQAAAEFVANSDRMADLLKNAPSGWENKNFQFVLHVKVVANQPVSADVVASQFW